jgi:hypothetical protein
MELGERDGAWLLQSKNPQTAPIAIWIIKQIVGVSTQFVAQSLGICKPH